MGTKEPPDCFDQCYGNASRDWMFDFGHGTERKSTMKDDYTEKKLFNFDFLEGIRRRTIKKELWEKIAKEVEEERKKDHKTTEKYCTTYDSELGKPEFKNSKIPKGTTELHIKYPLYQSEPVTFYKQLVDTSGTLSGTTPLPGMTKVTNLQVPFRRSYYFSKPLGERYDEPNLPENWKI